MISIDYLYSLLIDVKSDSRIFCTNDNGLLDCVEDAYIDEDGDLILEVD